jgi:hypothetical protein
MVVALCSTSRSRRSSMLIDCWLETRRGCQPWLAGFCALAINRRPPPPVRKRTPYQYSAEVFLRLGRIACANSSVPALVSSVGSSLRNGVYSLPRSCRQRLFVSCNIYLSLWYVHWGSGEMPHERSTSRDNRCLFCPLRLGHLVHVSAAKT